MQPKSKIKAGAGLGCGLYKFFTSSMLQSKFINTYNYDKEALIFGTGGGASVHFCNEPFSTSTDCIVAYAKNDVNLKLIYYYLSNNICLLQNGFKGAGLEHVSKDYILNIKLNIPEQSLQKRYVENLDFISHSIEVLNITKNDLDNLVKSRFIEMFGDPVHPISSRRLGDIALLERGRFSPRPRNDPQYYNGNYPFIQTGDIANCDHRLSEYKQTLNDKGIKVSKSFDKGTVVMAIVGATIGATAILQKKMYAPDSIIGIIPNKDICCNVFLEMLLRFWKTELQRIAPESARANINLLILREVPIVLADIHQQRDFASFAEQVDKSKLVVDKLLKKNELLKAALIQKYFG